MTPLFKWVGGKTRLLPAISEIIAKRPIRNYFESFLGGGALFFHIHDRIRGQAYLNDANIDLMEAYLQIATAPEGVVKHLQVFRDNNVDYYALRDEFNLKQVGLQRRAALFLALNHMGYNGLWRVNKTGHLNTPHGANGKGQPNSLANFPFDKLLLGSEVLKRAVLSAVSFRDLANSPHTSLNMQCGDGDFAFWDPPYLDVFSDYTKDRFGIVEHTILVSLAQRYAAKGALVILCGSDTDASLDVYGEPRVRVRSLQTVGASKRGEVHECLWVFGDRSETC